MTAARYGNYHHWKALRLVGQLYVFILVLLLRLVCHDCFFFYCYVASCSILKMISSSSVLLVYVFVRLSPETQHT